MLVSLQIHPCIFLQHTGFLCPITTALQHWSGRNAFLIAQSCSAKQADNYVVKRLCGVQCLITNALQHWSEQKAFLIAQSCSAKQADSIAVSHHQCTTAHVKTNAFLTAQTCFAKQADNMLVSLQIDLWVFAHHTGVQCPNFSALQY